MTEPLVERLKVHRRTLVLDRLDYTVLSPRPDAAQRFATNLFHDTWHVITSDTGGRLLGRILWAMAFQRRPRTIFVVDVPFIGPNPFDADPSSPIVIVNNELGPFGRDAAGALIQFLPLKRPSEGTVTLQTRGLDRALEDIKGFRQRERDAWPSDHQQRRWIDGENGVVVLAGPPPVLREWAVDVSSLGQSWYEGQSSEYLDYSGSRSGEVQILEAFSERVQSAMSERQRLFPGAGNSKLTEEDRSRIWSARSEPQ